MRVVTTASASALVLLLLTTPASAEPSEPAEACTPLAAESITQDAAGATWYVFRDSDGGVTNQVVPPPGFHPLTATVENLRRYHFAERPTDPAGLAAWTEKYRHFKGFAEPGICVQRGDHNNANKNWSGIEQSNANDQAYYRQATAQFFQPGWQFSCPSMSNASSWVGLGGSLTKRLIQAGTSGSATDGSKYLAWWEYLNGASGVPQQNWSLAVHPGDSIWPRVAFRAAGYAEFEVFNASTGAITPPTWKADATYYDGSTAEYVDERNYHTGTQVLLRNFGTVAWDHAWATNKFGTQIAPGNTVHESDWIVSSSGDVLARPDNGMTTSISWTDFWHGCG